MCGIAGILDRRSEALGLEIDPMVKALHHRGPDASGTWMDGQNGMALGHARLSIIDLSSEGNQPMVSPSGRYVLTYNGEVYNFRELRRELDGRGYSFHGHSDTEVMLAAFENWGVEKSLDRFVGMFAFGVWDRVERRLTLARDRLGKKPLYFGWMGSTFLFGSELKALQAHPGFHGAIDRDVLALYLRYGYVPAPYCIYRNLYQLMPGSVLGIPGDHAHRGADFSPFPESEQASWRPVRYWSAQAAVERGCSQAFSMSEQEAIDELDRLLRESVRMRMVADVPLGAFLSGGVDSSTVVALMQAQSTQPVRTFTIGFHEEEFNEARYAKEVATHLGTDHTELYVTPQDAMAVIPKLPQLYDEPFADSSQIPTFLVSELTRRHITVSLSGDGGDELFGGYTRYFKCQLIWNRLMSIPTPFRRGLVFGIRSVPPSQWTSLVRYLTPLLPRRLHMSLPGDKLYKLSNLLMMAEPEALYHRLISLWDDPEAVVLKSAEPSTTVTDRAQWALVPGSIEQMMYLDTRTYLPDDLLVKVDRASMGISLEVRTPLLDHRLVEWAWQLPTSLKVRGGEGKWILRQVLSKYVPRRLTERPKMGFGVPIGSWLRGPLRAWAESLIDEQRLRDEGFFDPVPIRKRWADHLSGQRDWQYSLWTVLMFQAWLDRQTA
ncbi:MAG TPA: asparagine synthase (glutamine-hydrolyzing) [Nitrospira sp.]|nr:asparagine synthase (glutamine-hydrolyzing) [Nitrospira sp.]